MTDHDLIIGLDDEFGAVTFCGGDSSSADVETALAFVRFVHTLAPTRIHPDDVQESCVADPCQSALALEYVFSDVSSELHAEIVVEFFATLTAAQRLRAWRGVRAQIMQYRQGCLSARVRPLIDALAERLGISASELIADAQPKARHGENPAVPFGWRLRDREPSPELAAWVKTIADDPATYPMFSSVSPSASTFGVQVLARVEWVRDAADSQPRRGVTLYEPDPSIY